MAAQVAVLLREASRAAAGGDAPGAIAAYERVIGEAPANTVALGALAELYLTSQRFDEAVDAADRGIVISPKTTGLWVAKANALQAMGRLEEARASFEKAVEVGPRDPAAWYGLAYTLDALNEVDAAFDAVERCLKRRSSNAMAQRLKAKLLRRTGDHEGAIEVVDSLLKRKPEDRIAGAALFERGMALDKLGRVDEAMASFVDGHRALWRPRSTGAYRPEIQEQVIESYREAVTPEVVAGWDPVPEASGASAGRDRPVFFVGFLRSGTTLLEQMLEAHPSVVTSNEAPTLPTMLRGIGSNPVAHARSLGGLDAAEIERLRGLYWETADSAVGGAAGRAIGDDEVWIDKMVMNSIALGAVRRVFPGARVLFAVRDPRDVVLSCVMQHMRPSPLTVHFRTIERAAGLYDLAMTLSMQYRDTLGLPWHEVRYESLVADPEGVVRGTLGFLGLGWDDAVLDHTAAGRARRVTTPTAAQLGDSIHTNSVARWERYRGHFGGAMKVLEPWVERLGYPAS